MNPWWVVMGGRQRTTLFMEAGKREEEKGRPQSSRESGRGKGRGRK